MSCLISNGRRRKGEGLGGVEGEEILVRAGSVGLSMGYG